MCKHSVKPGFGQLTVLWLLHHISSSVCAQWCSVQLQFF